MKCFIYKELCLVSNALRRFQRQHRLTEFQILFAPAVRSRGQLAAPYPVQRGWVAPVVIHQPQVVRG